MYPPSHRKYEPPSRIQRALARAWLVLLLMIILGTVGERLLHVPQLRGIMAVALIIAVGLFTTVWAIEKA